jgi:hypothetical protein
MCTGGFYQVQRVGEEIRHHEGSMNPAAAALVRYMFDQMAWYTKVEIDVLRI